MRGETSIGAVQRRVVGTRDLRVGWQVVAESRKVPLPDARFRHTYQHRRLHEIVRLPPPSQ
jgi:hypothetical protein